MTASLPDRAPGEHRDLAAFGRVYRETLGLVRAMLTRLGVLDAALDDATQDVYVVMYRHRARFDAGRPVEPWLVGISRRVAFRYRRSHARGQRAHAALAWANVATASPSPSGRIEARQFLEHFLAELGEERRQVFLLGELYGMTGPEISRHLEIPVDTAYTRLRAARLQLERALLAAAPAEPPPESGVMQRGWVLLLPRLLETPAPASGGWLLAALSKAQATIGVLVIAVVAAVVVVAAPASSGDRAIAAPAHAPGPARAANQLPTLAIAAPPVSLPPPPPNSRFQALLVTRSTPAPASPPAPVPTDPPGRGRDPLGAALMTTAVEALAAGDPATALALVEQHARDYPDSALEQTRPLTRIRALCQLGRSSEARGEAALLRARDPALAQDALAGTCAAGP